MRQSNQFQRVKTEMGLPHELNSVCVFQRSRRHGIPNILFQSLQEFSARGGVHRVKLPSHQVRHLPDRDELSQSLARNLPVIVNQVLFVQLLDRKSTRLNSS